MTSRTDIHPAAKVVAAVLATYSDGEGRAWPPITQLQTDTHLDKKTVLQAVVSLRDTGVITSTKVAAGDQLPTGRKAARSRYVYHLLGGEIPPKLRWRDSTPIKDTGGEIPPLRGESDHLLGGEIPPPSTIDRSGKDLIEREKPTEPPQHFSARQQAFFKALQQAEFYVRGRGIMTAWEAVGDPVRLAKNLGEEHAYPLVDPGLIYRLGSWSLENRSNSKNDIAKFILNRARYTQERGGPSDQRSPYQQNQPYPHSADLAEKVRNAR